MNSKKYIGLDVHQATISVAVMDSGRKLVMESILETKATTILQLFAGLRGNAVGDLRGRDLCRLVVRPAQPAWPDLPALAICANLFALQRAKRAQAMTAQGEFQHDDVRWNPDLSEWFCAKCGLTSDHIAREDAVGELSALECSLAGTRIKKLSDQQRKFRAKHQLRSQE